MMVNNKCSFVTQTLRLLAALNGGVLPGMNGGMLAGMNGGLQAGMNGGMLAGMNGGLANGAIPGMMAGGLNRPMVAGGGAGFFGQPQFAQVSPSSCHFEYLNLTAKIIT